MFWAIISKNNIQLVLIFGRVMESNGLYDFAQAFYVEKIWRALGMPVKIRKMPKTMFLAIFSKNYFRIVLIFCIVMETNGLYDLAKTVYAGKIWHV